jgi:peroxiredoxin Q/BCP
MKAFQADLSRLEAADTQVLGVSMDSPFDNQKFAAEVGATFPLLSDWDRQVSEEYGLVEHRDIQGVPMTLGRRATFLIGKDGKILEESIDNAAVDPTEIVTACERRKKSSGE